MGESDSSLLAMARRLCTTTGGSSWGGLLLLLLVPALALALLLALVLAVLVLLPTGCAAASSTCCCRPGYRDLMMCLKELMVCRVLAGQMQLLRNESPLTPLLPRTRPVQHRNGQAGLVLQRC